MAYVYCHYLKQPVTEHRLECVRTVESDLYPGRHSCEDRLEFYSRRLQPVVESFRRAQQVACLLVGH